MHSSGVRKIFQDWEGNLERTQLGMPKRNSRVKSPNLVN